MSKRSRDTSLVEYLAEQALEDIRRARQFKKSESDELLREAAELTNLASKILSKKEPPNELER